MSIAHISNSESGLSVRNKLNATIDIANYSVIPTPNDTSAAAANTAAIQAALDAKGTISLKGNGTAYINTTLIIGSNTALFVDPSLKIRMTTGVNANLLQSSAYNRAIKQNLWTTVTLTWTTGLLCTVNWTAHGQTATGAVWVQGTSGTTDSAFEGVFTIKSITDADHFVIELRRIPAASPSGTIKAIQADVNITVDGGQWDYNNSSGDAVGADRHIIVLAGVRTLSVSNVVGMDAIKFLAAFGAVSTYQFRNIQAVAGANKLCSDIFKVYGPAFDGIGDFIHGDCLDDALSFQPEEPAAFSDYDFTHGDVINGVFSNISVGDTGSGSAFVTYSHPSFIMDGIEINRINRRASVAPPVRIAVGDGLTGGRVGVLKLKNIEQRDDDQIITVRIEGTQTIQKIEVEDFQSTYTPVTSTNEIPRVNVSSGCTLGQLIVRDCRFVFPSQSASDNNFVRIQGTVDNIEIDGGYFTCNSGANGDIIGTSGTPSIGKITVKGVRANSLNSLVNLQSGVVTTPIVEVFDNYGDASAGVIAGSACQVVSLGNKLTSMGSGFVRANGANVTYYDLGGSTNAGTDTAAVNGTEIITAFTPYFIAKQTLSFVNRLATRPAGARTVLYDDFIQALIAAGVWNQLDAMFILGAYDEATALTNMVSSSFGFTKSGSPSFTQGIGYTNTGTTYLDSVFDPSTYGSHKLQQNSASIFAWAREMLGGTVCGIMGADGDLYIDPFFSDGNTYFAVNEGGGASASKPSNQTGLWAASRTASNAQVLYKDGASFITSANASHFNASGHMRVLVDGSFGDAMIGTVSAAGWGAGLNATQHANLYTAIQILLRSIEVSCFQSINASPQTNTLVPSSSTLMVDKKYRIYDGRKLTIQVNAAVRIMA